MEDAVRAGMSPKVSSERSKKALKRKVSLSAQKDSADGSNEDGTILNVTGTTEAQSVLPILKKKKRKNACQDAEKEIKVQEHSRKKRVKFNLESSIVNSEEKSIERQSKGKLVVNENEGAGKKELNKGVASWVQKASWTSLVGETGRFAFSFGSVLDHGHSILPDDNSNSLATSAQQPSMELHSSYNGNVEGSYSSESSKCCNQSNAYTDSTHEMRISSVDAQDGLKESIEHENAEGSAEYKQVLQSFSQSSIEHCTFMRSENYEQEWLEARRAVKEIFKRSRKDALRSIKMLHTRLKT